MTSPIIIAQKNTVGLITLNHLEKHNCLSPLMMHALCDAYQSLEKNNDVHVIILNANGKNFCSGADLDHMKAMAKASDQENLQDAKKLAQFFNAIYLCKKPTICCVHGNSLGGALGLIAAHDIAIATSDAEFCFPEVKVGLMPATIAPFVTQRMGYQHAKLHMLLAKPFSAKKAQEIRLIDYVCEDNAVAFALSLAESLSKNNLKAMQSTKQWLQTLFPITAEQLNRAAELLAAIRR